ncbi:menaquinone biosynthetic enzyme MqnA/MqnD family protein [Deinococcus lacus]|uniref:Chorismate dehydratase n=1 Tax=Deinococcus lacus TaxID=392561 RepID=A0ABW1YDN2_9DEIO
MPPADQPPVTAHHPSTYRAGWIHYTNVAPILDPLTLPPGVTAITGVPTQMNAALLEGRVDIANISAAEFIRHADRLAALPDFSVSVLGQVYSVNLFHTAPLENLRRIALTAQSATSVALLEVLLRERSLTPELVRDEGTAQELLARGYDGVLRIGDSALREWYEVVGPLGDDASMTRLPHGGGGVCVTDLSEEWYCLTGQPFVFAVWAYRKDAPPPPALLQAMRDARRQGLGELGVISRRHAERLGLPWRVVQHYLWNFRYHLEVPDRRGLQAFADLSTPGHVPLEFGPRPSSGASARIC